MSRDIISIGRLVMQLIPVLTLAQVSEESLPDRVIATTTADLRGQREIQEASQQASPETLELLWPFRYQSSRTAAATAAAGHLRHRVPQEARKAFDKADRLSRSGKTEAAAIELEHAIGRDPDFAEAHGDLGVQYARLGRYELAVAELRRTIALMPEVALPYANLSWVLLQIGCRTEAESILREALRLSPTDARAHFLLGQLLLLSPERKVEALMHLESAARTMPEAKRVLKTVRTK